MNHLLAILTPPPGVSVCQGPLCDVAGNSNGLSEILSIALRLIWIVGGFVMLIFLIMGAISYITSGGDKEKTHEAQQKITHAVIGFVILFLVWGLWILIVSDVLGIFGPNGAIILPSLGGNSQ